jgi:hypothetical protein
LCRKDVSWEGVHVGLVCVVKMSCGSGVDLCLCGKDVSSKGVSVFVW